jgi:succinate dehydrogenase flavin-adding protein (antitoxin of CptAB toxin-antitoxin module)
MDILLSSFVNKYIDDLDEISLFDLEKFLDFEDEIILNFYNYSLVEKKIDENKISKIFKDYKL